MYCTPASESHLDGVAGADPGWAFAEAAPHNNSEGVARLLLRLGELVRRGGPQPHEYAEVTECFRMLADARVRSEQVAEVFAPTLTGECIHGFGYLKPHGYAGDYEMIDRIHTYWESSNPSLVRWDRFFHQQAAPKAVRNRIRYLGELLERIENTGAGSASVLNLGCGPARDLHNYFRDHTGSRLQIRSIDLDPQAIQYASALCAQWSDRLKFECRNVLRYRPGEQYDLVWSSGLFDYFSDRLVVVVLKRLLTAVKPGGELVIGNFGSVNPSRGYMELLGKWYLEHRSEAALRQLAREAGVHDSDMRIEREPEGVNLFLHIRGVTSSARG
jgi:SAM-dependent methyltransferase